MDDADSKKRKRKDKTSTKANKKIIHEGSPTTATVSSLLRPSLCPPVIGMT